MGARKQLERKLSEAQADVEEQRKVVNKWRRKAQKTQGEMNDMKILLEEQTARNSLLEKKQRKFDHDLALANEDKKQEPMGRENVQKELDSLKLDKFGLEEELDIVTHELELKEEKVAALARELEDVQLGAGGGDELKHAKKDKLDLEIKMRDQEEELDDMAGHVQMLEAAKIKLEMEIATIRKEQRKEAANKENELDEMREVTSKRVRVLEQQLEQEHEERVAMMREKHEMEDKMRRMQEVVERAGDEDKNERLRKDLKRTKALLRDAHLPR